MSALTLPIGGHIALFSIVKDELPWPAPILPGNLLRGAGVYDSSACTASTGFLFVLTPAASRVPAPRAARIDPTEALRSTWGQRTCT